MKKREIYIEETETGEFLVSFNFDCEYDDDYCELLVDAEAFADEVSNFYGGIEIKNSAA